MDNHLPLLAVLIDADNVPARYVDAIFTEITSLGEPSVRRIYGDFSNPHLKKWSAILAEHAIVPIHQPANTVGKNASDIALVIDGMDLLLSGRVNGFVLVSSDSDFTRLASRIREQGLPVYGIGERKTPAAFRKACKRFIFIENIQGSSEPVENKSNDEGKIEPRVELAPPEIEKGIFEPVSKEPPSKSVPLILAAMRGIDTEDGWYNLGPVGQKLVADNPDFDSRSYGCPNLSTLLEKTGQFMVDREAKPIKIRRLRNGAKRK
jgi:uncharacterized LabA/DUF88 family protein